MPVHASSLAPATRTRRIQEIRRPSHYGLDEPIHHFRVVTAVAVEKDDDFAVRGDRAQPRAKRPPISALGLCYHASASGGCDFRSSIGTAVIDDDYFIGDISRNRGEHIRNRLLFVERGDDY